jgi:negative regulator of flagellin synthesis FlgM
MVIDPNAGGVGKNRLLAPTQDSAKGLITKDVGSSARSAASSAAPASTDNVSLSGKGRAMSRLESKVQNSPEVNAAKVDAIKQSIAKGEFRINPDAIAEKMLSDF